MASYKIVIEKRAEKELRKLPNSARAKIVTAVDLLADNPRPANSRKLVNSTAYRLRVGEFRVLYEIEDAVVTIFVIKIAHRKDVYRQK